MDRAATRILLVEDDSVIAYDIKSLLAELGYDVLDVVATGAEAVAAAAALSPDLVIMDITLEGEMDGIETALRIQKSGDMPIVYLTAHTDIHTFLAAKKTNPYGYCMKPAGAHEIYSVVEMAVHRHSLEKRLRRAGEELTLALEESKRREREVNALLEASRALLAHRDFQESAPLIFRACRELIGARAGYIALLDDRGEENEVLYLDPGEYACEVDPALPMPVRGLRAEAYRANAVVYDNDFANSRHREYLPRGHVTLENALFAPIPGPGRAIGLLGLGNKAGGFNEQDARMAAAFAELAAVGLRGSLPGDRL